MAATSAGSRQLSMNVLHDIGRHHLLGTPRRAFGNTAVTCAIVSAEALLIIAAAVVSGVGYHYVVYGNIGTIANYTAFGMLAALLYVVPFVGQGESSIRTFLAGGRSMQRIALRWHVTFLLIALVGFLTKTTDVVSRGWVALFFLIGLFGLLRLEPAATRVVRWALAQGRVRPRRLMLVGSDDDLAAYRAKRSRNTEHDLIVAVTRLAPEQLVGGAAALGLLSAALRSAGDDARSQGVDGILLLPSTRRADILNACLDSFSLLPVSVHLDAFSDIEHDRQAEDRVGRPDRGADVVGVPGAPGRGTRQTRVRCRRRAACAARAGAVVRAVRRAHQAR